MTIWNSGRWQRRRENERFIAQKSGPARLFYNLKCAFPSVTSKDTMRGRWERKSRWPIFDIPFGNQLCSLWRGHGNVEDRDKRKRGERGGWLNTIRVVQNPIEHSRYPHRRWKQIFDGNLARRCNRDSLNSLISLLSLSNTYVYHWSPIFPTDGMRLRITTLSSGNDIGIQTRPGGHVTHANPRSLGPSQGLL